MATELSRILLERQYLFKLLKFTFSMKHSPVMTIILLVSFLLAQFFGLLVIYNYIDTEQTALMGKTTFKELPIGERPPMEEKISFLPVIIAVLIGTALLFVIIRYQLMLVWKGWFLLAVVLSLFVAFNAFVPVKIAFFVALFLGLWKIFKPNFVVQNLTEIMLYGGLAAIFVPMFNLWSVVILLILISLYDAYAVWKSKHMIVLAQAQAKAKMFAGLLIPYKWGKLSDQKMKSTGEIKVPQKKVRTAILGGGDLGFPLIFAGVVMKELGLWSSLVIPFFAALGLGVLLLISKEKKFYPAMPFISAGCFLGLGLIFLFRLFF